MKVYVVYDPLYEEVVSVHKTEKGASDRALELNEKDKMGKKRESYFFEWGSFELEE